MNGVIPVSPGMVKAFTLAGSRPVLVDTGTRGNASRTPAGLEGYRARPADIGLAIVTHAHADHYGSLGELKKTISAPVAAHRLDAGSLREDRGHEPKACIEPEVLIDDEFDLRQYGVASELKRPQ